MPFGLSINFAYVAKDAVLADAVSYDTTGATENSTLKLYTSGDVLVATIQEDIDPDTQSAATADLTGIAIGNGYYFKLEEGPGGEDLSDESDPFDILEDISNFRVTAHTATTITLAWDAWASLSGHTFFDSDGQVATNDDFAEEHIVSTFGPASSETGILISDLTPGTLYYFRVRLEGGSPQAMTNWSETIVAYAGRDPTCSIAFGTATPGDTKNVSVNTTNAGGTSNLNLYNAGDQLIGESLALGVDTNTVGNVSVTIPAEAPPNPGYYVMIVNNTTEYYSVSGTFEILDTVAPTYDFASVREDGLAVIVTFLEASGLLPEGIAVVTGASISVAGRTAPAIIQTGTDATNLYLSLATPIYADDEVTLSYVPGNLTDNADPPNAVLAFSNQPVTNNSTAYHPGILSRTARTTTSITIAWTDPTGGVAPYTSQLQKSAHGADSWSNVASGTTSPKTVTGLSAGTYYDFRVVYTDDDETSVNSETFTARTLTSTTASKHTHESLGLQNSIGL